MPRPEKPAGRVAVLQALHFHFHLSCSEIASLVNRSTKAIYWQVRGSPNVRPWFKRQEKRAAIDAARELLRSSELTFRVSVD